VADNNVGKDAGRRDDHDDAVGTKAKEAEMPHWARRKSPMPYFMVDG
jgi:hypothetical protein